MLVHSFFPPPWARAWEPPCRIDQIGQQSRHCPEKNQVVEVAVEFHRALPNQWFFATKNPSKRWEKKNMLSWGDWTILDDFQVILRPLDNRQVKEWEGVRQNRQTPLRCPRWSKMRASVCQRYLFEVRRAVVFIVPLSYWLLLLYNVPCYRWSIGHRSVFV